VPGTVIVAPHADDETLGGGGTLLRHHAEGRETHWVIVTAMTEHDYSLDTIKRRRDEIEKVAQRFAFSSVHELGFPTKALDDTKLPQLIESLGEVVNRVAPDTLLLPFPDDVHSDHRVVFDAAASLTKWFRFPSIQRVAAYETLSETEFQVRPDRFPFRPSLFVNIESYLDAKIHIAQIYESEFREFPFPRSGEAIRAQAALRGAASGCRAAEAFHLIRLVE